MGSGAIIQITRWRDTADRRKGDVSHNERSGSIASFMWNRASGANAWKPAARAPCPARQAQHRTTHARCGSL